MMRTIFWGIAALALLGGIQPAASQPYVGERLVFAGTFCPAGWLPLEGQQLPIAENETLFVLLGTTYGGDGQSTFALPNVKPIITANGGPNGANNIALTQCISLFGVFPPPP